MRPEIAGRLKSVLVLFTLLAGATLNARAEMLRPPAVPLVTFDPYLSIWSEADKLTDKKHAALDASRTGTGKPDPG